MVDEYSKCVVLDCGSSSMKGGFAGEDAPRAVSSSVVGTRRFKAHAALQTSQSKLFGEEAQWQRATLSLEHPIQRGIITNIDAMEDLWRHTLSNYLRVFPWDDYAVLLSQAVLNPKLNGQKILQSMFETFEANGCYLSNPGTLALYSSGRTTGLSVGIGDGVTQLIPIDEGYCPRNAIQRFNFGGFDLTRRLQEELLPERGVHELAFGTAEREIVRDIKEKLCFAALDFEEEMKNSAPSSSCERNYELPDGQVIAIGNERFRCIEPLFNPSLLNLEFPGIHQMIFDTIMKCSIDRRKDYFANLVFYGGATMVPGFGERVVKELKNLAPSSIKIKTILDPERKNSVWIGGSILASLSTFQSKWITKEQYNETGPILANQCF